MTVEKKVEKPVPEVDKVSPGSENTKSESVVEPQSQFTRDNLKGKSAAEIERYLDLLEGTVKEQGSALSKAEREKAEALTKVANPVQPISEEERNRQWFENPAAAMANEQKASEDRIIGSFKEMIEPFKMNLAQDAEATAIAQFRARYPDVDRFLPEMRLFAQNARASLAAPGNVEAYYYLARGKASAEGTLTSETPVTTTVKPVVELPQGRSQNGPLPDTRKETPVRELTENERRLARENNLTDEQYLKWIEVDPSDVVDYKGDKPNA